jgi:hypothetical protein
MKTAEALQTHVIVKFAVLEHSSSINKISLCFPIHISMTEESAGVGIDSCRFLAEVMHVQSA